MKNKKSIIVIVIVIVLGLFIISFLKMNNPSPTLTMILTSPSFKDGAFIPKKFTCDGGNINPELHIENAPDGAKSLALIMHDPDAPMPGGFTHWVAWNIAPMTSLIKEESAPLGAVEGMNSRNRGYTGPCPPSGTHHYEFRLYALDVLLNIAETSDKAELEAAMRNHIIAETKLTGLFKRAAKDR